MEDAKENAAPTVKKMSKWKEDRLAEKAAKEAAAKAPKVHAQMTITMYDNQRVEVSAPLDNPAICYAMIGLGQDILKEHWTKAAERGAAQQIAAAQTKGSLPWWRRVVNRLK